MGGMFWQGYIVIVCWGHVQYMSGYHSASNIVIALRALLLYRSSPFPLSYPMTFHLISQNLSFGPTKTNSINPIHSPKIHA